MKGTTKRTAKKLCAAVLAMALSAAVLSQSQAAFLPASAVTTLSDLQKKQKENQQKLKDLKNKIAANQNNIAKQEQNQKYIQQQIDLTQENIRVISAQCDEIAANISAKEQDIANQEEAVSVGIDEFKVRMRAMYMTGDGGMASVLAGSNDFCDLLSRTEMVKRVAKKNDEIIKNLNDELAQLEIDKQELEVQKQAADQKKVELESSKTELQNAYASSSQEQSRLQKEIQEYQENRAAIDKADEELEAQIKKIIAEQAKTKTYVGGTFTWPLPGFTYISSPFSPARTLNGKTRAHKGTDIAGSGVNGQTIVAANSGTVITASTGGWGGGYGTYCMIDHGGGYVTLYGHCSTLLVSNGQKVKKGDPIAKVGNTGDSTGPHLHFEVRINGTPTNPMQYFS